MTDISDSVGPITPKQARDRIAQAEALHRRQCDFAGFALELYSAAMTALLRERCLNATVRGQLLYRSEAVDDAARDVDRFQDLYDRNESAASVQPQAVNYFRQTRRVLDAFMSLTRSPIPGLVGPEMLGLTWLAGSYPDVDFYGLMIGMREQAARLSVTAPATENISGVGRADNSRSDAWVVRCGGLLKCSPGCSLVSCDGREYKLSNMPKAVFAFMLDVYEQGRNSFSKEELLEEAGSTSERVKDAVGPVLWNTFVVGERGTKGRYRLQIPPNVKSDAVT